MVYLKKAVHNEGSVQSLRGGRYSKLTRDGNSQKGNALLAVWGSNLQADSAESTPAPKTY